MAALGWQLNLDFAASPTPDTDPADGVFGSLPLVGVGRLIPIGMSLWAWELLKMWWEYDL